MAGDEDMDNGDEPDEEPNNGKGNGTTMQKTSSDAQTKALEVKNLNAGIRNKNMIFVVLILVVVFICCCISVGFLRVFLQLIGSIGVGASGPY
jgi:hypothetical protein